MFLANLEVYGSIKLKHNQIKNYNIFITDYHQ